MALSYAHGTTNTPLRSETIGRLWNAVAAEHGGRDALVSRQQRISWTYAELDAQPECRLVQTGTRPPALPPWRRRNPAFLQDSRGMANPSRKPVTPQKKEGAAELFDPGLSKSELVPAADREPRVGLAVHPASTMLAFQLAVSDRSKAERA